jgi:hypothetical protein
LRLGRRGAWWLARRWTSVGSSATAWNVNASGGGEACHSHLLSRCTMVTGVARSAPVFSGLKGPCGLTTR